MIKAVRSREKEKTDRSLSAGARRWVRRRRCRRARTGATRHALCIYFVQSTLRNSTVSFFSDLAQPRVSLDLENDEAEPPARRNEAEGVPRRVGLAHLPPPLSQSTPPTTSLQGVSAADLPREAARVTAPTSAACRGGREGLNAALSR